MGIDMNDAVIPEIQLLLFSVLAGIFCFLGYDLLLVFRAFLKRPLLIEKIEDVLYWCAASILVFSMIHQRNSGVIRGYSIAGMLAGMIVYRAAVKDRLVLGAQRIAKKLGKWGKKKLEPLRKKKKELQIKRKQVKIEKKNKRLAAREAKRVKQEERALQAARLKEAQEGRKKKKSRKAEKKQKKKQKRKKKQERE